jgi:hypothetical protein
MSWPTDLRAFLQALAGTAGTEVNGNRLSEAAQGTLASLDILETQLAKYRGDYKQPGPEDKSYVMQPGERWICFHCGERFPGWTEDGRAAAREHFGTGIRQQPACQIDIAEYRRMESQVEQWREEIENDSSEARRALAQLQSGTRLALQRAEEAGYAAGLKDYTALEQRLALAQQQAEGLEARFAAINTPEIADFLKAVENEALHQRDRWGSDGDAGKTDADWFWLVGYLAGKALHKPEKVLHHIITTAAACLNWHAAKLGVHIRMRPGHEEGIYSPGVAKDGGK